MEKEFCEIYFSGQNSCHVGKAADIAHERRKDYELINDPQALANNYIYVVEHSQ